MNRFGLSSVLFFWLLISVMVPTFLLSALYLSSFKETLLEQEQEHLSQFADKKVKEVEDYISERIADAFTLSQSAEVIELFSLLLTHYQVDREGRDYLEILQDYQEVYQQYTDYGYLDLLFITPSEEVIFSLTDKHKFDKEQLPGEAFSHGLHGVIQKAKYFLESSSSSFEYSPLLKQATAYIGAPILLDGKLLGVIVLQVDSQIIQRVTLDVSGNLSSREVVVAAKRGSYFSYQAQLKYDSEVKIGGLQPVFKLPKPLSNAISGLRGVVFAEDYRGEQVIAATRYIPSVQWGLVLKEDLDDVMSAYHELLRLSIFMFLVVIFCVLLLSGFLGRWLAKPFESMIEMTQAIASGTTKSTIFPQGTKESYALALSFNQMTHSLALARETLEQQVEERTRDLTHEISLRESKERALTESYKELNESMERLQSMQSQLVETEKMASLGGLVAGFAHELNTPIGVAITASSLFLRELIILEECYKNSTLTEVVFDQYLSEIKDTCFLLDKNLKRTASLVSNFKLVAVEQTNLHKEKFDLRDLVDSLLKSLTPETKKYPVEIINEIPSEIIINSYAGDFYQLLTNLVLNAMIHAFDGMKEGRLTICASQCQYNLVLTVADNGKGVSQDHLSCLFEPFFTTRRGSGGSGLGLSIVYNIVTHKLRGDIQVSSIPGQGTEFIITFPIDTEEQS
ncbi:sensor histidine kinase [Shewanella woodyi]|uniref:histidine kinase n=1 Tax=Shewanella woodyi (strain ATCC 51908 / MS32) TaxID=392500 RepID=B1KEM3_SHEWM|nr:sensor histidine kinase [Shewanella woodyi]ACA88038.1 integral membrane sensor signal transduction histidine kinase [Shewanella woodyi ATCC 51908]